MGRESFPEIPKREAELPPVVLELMHAYGAHNKALLTFGLPARWSSEGRIASITASLFDKYGLEGDHLPDIARGVELLAGGKSQTVVNEEILNKILFRKEQSPYIDNDWGSSKEGIEFFAMEACFKSFGERVLWEPEVCREEAWDNSRSLIALADFLIEQTN